MGSLSSFTGDPFNCKMLSNETLRARVCSLGTRFILPAITTAFDLHGLLTSSPLFTEVRMKGIELEKKGDDPKGQ